MFPAVLKFEKGFRCILSLFYSKSKVRKRYTHRLKTTSFGIRSTVVQKSSSCLDVNLITPYLASTSLATTLINWEEGGGGGGGGWGTRESKF